MRNSVRRHRAWNPSNLLRSALHNHAPEVSYLIWLMKIASKTYSFLDIGRLELRHTAHSDLNVAPAAPIFRLTSHPNLPSSCMVLPRYTIDVAGCISAPLGARNGLLHSHCHQMHFAPMYLQAIIPSMRLDNSHVLLEMLSDVANEEGVIGEQDKEKHMKNGFTTIGAEKGSTRSSEL